MKLAAICIRNANKRQIIAGNQVNFWTEYDRALPIITGIAAPLNVLGLDARIQACREFSRILVIFRFKNKIRITLKNSFFKIE